jgi:NADH-quinone oxidoreductase subunit D
VHPKLRATEGREPVVVDDNKITPPRRAEMKVDGSADPSFQALYRGLPVPAGEVYAAVEAPRVSSACIHSDGSNKPYKCKIRAWVCPPAGGISSVVAIC